MKNVVITLIILLSGCANQQTSQQRSSLSDKEAYLASGFEKLSNKDTSAAIVDFDKAIVLCNNLYSSTKQQAYSSRGMTETLYYMLKAAAENKSAIAVSPTCAEALYLRGYASLELGQIESAEEHLQKAIGMSPVNSMYLSEMGHLLHLKRDWESALDIYIRSESAAMTYSPEELKVAELTRAKRGIGYSLIELRRLDEAEQKYRECLEINKNDQAAIRELEYIESIRSNLSTST